MKRDCFAYKENVNKAFCKALKEINCIDCSFYKTKEQQKNSIKKANIILSSLDKVTQKNIADKYYQGKYSWNNKGKSLTTETVARENRRVKDEN